MKKLTIIYEDKDLLIIDKPTNILTVGTDKEKTKTLYYEASMYVKKQHPKNKIFIVNRLDKETSGLVVFAKNEKLKHYLQDNWYKVAILREYYAIVEGRLKKDKGKITSYLKENKMFHVYSTNDKNDKYAVTNYEVEIQNKNYSLLRIFIETGRKHQIRVHLSDLGHPIVGDKKYGSKKNPFRRLCLVANKLVLNINGKNIVVETKIPKEFMGLIEGGK